MRKRKAIDSGIRTPTRLDVSPIAIILLIPFLVAFPDLTGLLKSNPMLTYGYMGIGVTPGILPGTPYLDPNVGYTIQALGKLADQLWLKGSVPWWNHYSGAGMPLAAEFQPAAFSPANLLLLLPHGVIFRHLFMQYVAGIGTYFFMRQIGLSAIASSTGALLFAQNGALALFAHAPPDPGCFLPWVLLGVEYAAISSDTGASIYHGWVLLSAALAAMILAGFPETAFICGAFVGFYSTWRWFKCHARYSMAGRVLVGLIVGIALSAPQVLAFAEFLPSAIVGGHNGVFGHMGLGPDSIIPFFLAPYVYGPLVAFHSIRIYSVLGNLGGYSGLLILVVAAAGMAARRDSLVWVLIVWIILCALKIFEFGPVANVWNLIPGMTTVAFYRYASSAFEFAVILLACFGLEAIVEESENTNLLALVSIIACLAGLIVGCFKLPSLWGEFSNMPGVQHWIAGSFAWMTLSSISAVIIIAIRHVKHRGALLACLLIFDATVMFSIPTLSTPRQGYVDRVAVAFLKKNLGWQRFYTLGPIAPNYGAYFQIASINHDYLPVPVEWTSYVKSHLDPLADDIAFWRPSDGLTAFRAHLVDFSNLGVKYLVTARNIAPFPNVRPVFQDALLAIFLVPNSRPYVSTSLANCSIIIKSRDFIEANCSHPAQLVRREMFFPGWDAYVNGKEVHILKVDGLFQSIDLPAGTSRIRFQYAPPHVIWGWSAFWMGIIVLSGAILARYRRK